MIVLLCGPSGSGKSTLLARLAKMADCAVIPVGIKRPGKDREPEIGRMPISGIRRLPNGHLFNYSYGGTRYAVAIPGVSISSKKYEFIDYPGEYPQCCELSGIDWRGILVLPPSIGTLMFRLFARNRARRIPSAIFEFFACQRELRAHVYDTPQWRIYISRNLESIAEFKCGIENHNLFREVAANATPLF